MDELTLAFVKSFLRVDDDDDDDYLTLLLSTAREYVTDALGQCDESIARVRLLELVIIAEMYEKRTLTFGFDATNTKAQYTIRSIINQLQWEDEADE